MSKVLVLTDGKAGHENQSKAFARALGCDFDIVEVHFRSRIAKIASYILDRVNVYSLGLYDVDLRRLCCESGYRAVIGTGSGTFYAAKALARYIGVKCGVVLYPRGYKISTFDCVLAPAFDKPVKADNVIEIPANLVANDDVFYANGVASFMDKAPGLRVFGNGGSSPVAVIIGGPNKCSTMTPEWMREQLSRIFEEGKSIPDAEYWVTTSRRTPLEVEAVVDSYPFDYKLLYSRDHFNPIPAFVKLAKRLYVTAESTGMLSESCTFGAAEVVALDNLNPGQHKFRRFVDDLRKDGYVDGNRKVDLSGQFRVAKRLMGL